MMNTTQDESVAVLLSLFFLQRQQCLADPTTVAGRLGWDLERYARVTSRLDALGLFNQQTNRFTMRGLVVASSLSEAQRRAVSRLAA